MFKTLRKFFSNLFATKCVKYVGTCKCQLADAIWGNIRTVTIAVYQKYDPMSGKIYAVWGEGAGSKIHFNVDAFKRGKLIEK